LDADVRLGAAFLKAYFHGARDFLAGKSPAFMDQFARDNDLDPKLVKAGCRDSFEPDGRLHLEDIQVYLDWMHKNGYVSGAVSAQSLVDTRYLHALQTS